MSVSIVPIHQLFKTLENTLKTQFPKRIEIGKHFQIKQRLIIITFFCVLFVQKN
jgi:hypothetical protein